MGGIHGKAQGLVPDCISGSLEQLWKINVGSGFSAPQMTFETCVRQYVAIVSGPSPAARARLVNTPELREQCNALMLYVFGLRKIARSND
jgi:hypothetical protein